jgi:hypothetical protein
MTEKEGQIKKFTIAFEPLVLLVILFVTTFLPADIFSPILVLTGFLLLSLTLGRIKRSYLNIIIPLIGIFIIGFFGISGHESRHVFRDISYSLTPISLIFIGYWMSGSKIMWPGILKILILGGIIIACIHLLKFVLNPGVLGQVIADIRLKAPNPNVSLVCLSLVLGIFQKRFMKGDLFPVYFPKFIALPILFLSFVLSFSRTSLVLAIVLSISIIGWVGRINMKAALTIAFLVISFFLLIITSPKDDITTFRGKLARTLTEISVSDYKDSKEINDNWRGYETYRAINEYKSGNAKQKILGHGFGSLVELGLTKNLGGVDFTEIPILHNGYAYILVKTGIFGILCYIFFYSNLLIIALKYRNALSSKQVLFSRLLLGCTLSLLLSMYVVGGMAEIHDSEYVLLVGFILNRMDKLKLITDHS